MVSELLFGKHLPANFRLLDSKTDRTLVPTVVGIPSHREGGR